MRRLLVRIATALAVLAVLGGIVLGAGIGLGAWALWTTGPLPQAIEIVVPRGSIPRVATALRAAGVVSSRLSFELAALVTRGDGQLRAAEFAFPAHASLREVLEILRHGRPVEHRITVAEGLTAAEIAVVIAGADALSGPVTVPREGAVLPQTYDYERGVARAALVERMGEAMRRALDLAWRQRDPAVALASPRAMLVLASIVERETGIAAERPMVAAVFLNRLRLGMRLQSDPTAAYVPAGGLGALDRRLTRADLENPNAYNTYAVAGLPPGPICSPGTASLEAVAHPARTDALYFVATGAGGHAFAATLAEHLRNVSLLRAVEKGR